jgi:hypothetical protein
MRSFYELRTKNEKTAIFQKHKTVDPKGSLHS